MQYELLDFLRCPITKTKLKFELIREFQKNYLDRSIVEIAEGILFSETGFIFPIIDGIPRMQIESFYDYSSFLRRNLNDYESIRLTLESKFGGLIDYCLAKNKKSKKSFEFEWSFLNSNRNDKLWHEDVSNLLTVFTEETNQHQKYFLDKTVIDVGCGHGIMTSRIAECAKLAIGVELSNAVERAYINNSCYRAWYLQGDLQFLPFENFSFDYLYCSGVIHHTNDTELSFLLIESVVKSGGKLCLWLYHPQKDILHRFFLLMREVTRRLPLKVSFLLISIFVFPVSYLVKKVKRKKPPNFREEMIDLLDHFTPKYRFEIQHDLARTWMDKRMYSDVKITTENKFGFSIVGEKVL